MTTILIDRAIVCMGRECIHFADTRIGSMPLFCQRLKGNIPGYQVDPSKVYCKDVRTKGPPAPKPNPKKAAATEAMRDPRKPKSVEDEFDAGV
jgi:hypothetical protein